MVNITTRSLDDELKNLDAKIAQMGGLAEQALLQAIDSVAHKDPELAQATLANDRAIDHLQRSIDDYAICLIARRQPVANDLRQIITAIRISGNLERIGDLAKNIAKRAIAIAGANEPKQITTGFTHIGESALGQLKDVLDAYSQRDAAKAQKVWRKDDEIDAMYNSLFAELLRTMMEEPHNVGLYTHLLFSAKNIERIGDHATNIAETTYYLIHGTAFAEERPTTDNTSFTLFSAPQAARLQQKT